MFDCWEIMFHYKWENFNEKLLTLHESRIFFFSPLVLPSTYKIQELINAYIMFIVQALYQQQYFVEIEYNSLWGTHPQCSMVWQDHCH